MQSLILLLPLAVPLSAHNGAVAIAVPVEGIVVDGDLSDWPEGIKSYPIHELIGGDEPLEASDIEAELRVAYSQKVIGELDELEPRLRRAWTQTFSGILDAHMQQTKSQGVLFADLNRSLYRSLSDHKFIFTMAEIDTDTKKLRLASCGSPYPLHVHNGEVTELKIDGYPLGVRERHDLRHQRGPAIGR